MAVSTGALWTEARNSELLSESAVKRWQCAHISLGEVPVQGGRIELSQAVYFVDVGINAVGHRDVYQPVVGAKRYCWLGPLFGQWVQP